MKKDKLYPNIWRTSDNTKILNGTDDKANFSLKSKIIM